MKRTGKQELEQPHEALLPQMWASHTVYDLLASNRMLREQKSQTAQDQVIAFLTKQGVQDNTSVDLQQTSYSISYKFGEWKLERYPKYSARMDKSQSMRLKQRELARIGMDQRGVKTFGEIGNPEWGETFRGIGAQDGFFKFMMDRQTYRPFRQELHFLAGPNGEFDWKYAFTLFTPESLSFWTPNDTMGVNTPEFKHASWIWEPICLSGGLDNKGRLEVSDVHFGTTYSRTGVPNFKVDGQSKSEIVLAQLKNGWTEAPSRKYVIRVPHLRNMFEWIVQDDAKINTNPLFPFQMTGEPEYNVSLGKKA